MTTTNINPVTGRIADHVVRYHNAVFIIGVQGIITLIVELIIGDHGVHILAGGSVYSAGVNTIAAIIKAVAGDHTIAGKNTLAMD